jgi:quercetin dioxygenase-like cupin family protein
MSGSAVQADLVSLLSSRSDSGPLWSTESEDLDCTYVSWQSGQGVPVHINSEVDVVMVVLSGYGQAQIGGEVIELARGKVVLVPKGISRSVQASGDGLSYLNVHKRRKRLMPGDGSSRGALQASLRERAG